MTGDWKSYPTLARQIPVQDLPSYLGAGPAEELVDGTLRMRCPICRCASSLHVYFTRTGTDRLAWSAAKVTPSSSTGRARGIPPTGSPSLICSDCDCLSSRKPKPKVSTGGGTQYDWLGGLGELRDVPSIGSPIRRLTERETSARSYSRLQPCVRYWGRARCSRETQRGP